MSWKAAGVIKGLTENLARSEKLILLVLADYYNDETGQCNPSVKRLSSECLISDRQLRRLLHSLERKGFISINERRDGSRQDANQYDLIILQTVTASVCAEPTQTDKTNGLRLTFPTSQTDIAMSPKPSLTVRENRKNIPGKNAHPRKIPRTLEELPPGLVDTLVKDYAWAWDEARVREIIAGALDHDAARKRTDAALFLRGWLRRDVERMPTEWKAAHPDPGRFSRGPMAHLYQS